MNGKIFSGSENVSIKTVETENEGLKRAFMLTIPAKDIEARVDQEVKRLARRSACRASARERSRRTSFARCMATACRAKR